MTALEKAHRALELVKLHPEAPWRKESVVELAEAVIELSERERRPKIPLITEGALFRYGEGELSNIPIFQVTQIDFANNTLRFRRGRLEFAGDRSVEFIPEKSEEEIRGGGR